MKSSAVLRECRKCKEPRELSEFRLRLGGQHSRWCRGCMFDACRSTNQKRIRIVTFATEGEYEREAQGLMESASDFGLSVHLSVIARRAWAEAVAFKPTFLRMQFDRFPDAEGFLWVDADAMFDAAPDFSVFDGAHIAYHRFQWSRTHPIEHLTGTLYIANTPTMRGFCEEWAEQTRHYTETDTPEQHALRWMFEQMGPHVCYTDPGPRWCWIEDDAYARVYESERNPIVCHFQASRRLKHSV